MKPEKALTGQFGVYFICAKLCWIGLNAVPTSRNTKAVDLIVHNPQDGSAVGVQVKTLRQQHKTDQNRDFYPVVQGTYAEVDKLTFQNPFAFVYIPNSEKLNPRCFVVPPKDVTKLLVDQWEWYRDNVKHRKPMDELIRKRIPLCIYIWQLLGYEECWENLWERA